MVSGLWNQGKLSGPGCHGAAAKGASTQQELKFLPQLAQPFFFVQTEMTKQVASHLEAPCCTLHADNCNKNAANLGDLDGELHLLQWKLRSAHGCKLQLGCCNPYLHSWLLRLGVLSSSPPPHTCIAHVLCVSLASHWAHVCATHGPVMSGVHLYMFFTGFQTMEGRLSELFFTGFRLMAVPATRAHTCTHGCSAWVF